MMDDSFVILTDDNYLMVKLMRRYLESADYKIIPAYDGEQCLERIKDCLSNGDKISCVILDSMMPKLDGYKTVEQIRSNPIYQTSYQLPVLLITSLNNNTNFIKIIEAGFDDYLTKPVEEKLLVAKVNMLSRICSLEEKILALNT